MIQSAKVSAITVGRPGRDKVVFVVCNTKELYERIPRGCRRARRKCDEEQ